MFNLGVGEVFVILLIALMIFGPNKLPEMARSIGKTIKMFQIESQKATAVFKEALEPPKSTTGVVDRPDAGAADQPPPSPGRVGDAVAEPAPEGNGRVVSPARDEPPAPPLDRESRLLEDT